MTILAVVGLTAAIIIVAKSDETYKEQKEEIAKLRERHAQKQSELDTLREVKVQLQDSLGTLNARIDSLFRIVGDLHRIIIGASPCLGNTRKQTQSAPPNRSQRGL